MAELLTIARRGPRCWATADVSGGDDTAFFQCNLKVGHPGPLHYDETDDIWWAGAANA